MRRGALLTFLLWGLLGVSASSCLAAPPDTLRLLACNIRHGSGMDGVAELM